MKSTAIMAAVAILSCLLLLCAQGQPTSKPSRCMCSDKYAKLTMQFLMRRGNEFVVYHPSIFCPKVEIILTMAEGKKKCVDPESRLGQMVLKQDSLRKKAAASSTVASSQTETWSPATVQTTSNL